MIAKNRKYTAGFSLLEVMLATVLLAVISLGATAFCTHAMRQMKWAQDQQIMLDYAEYYLELFKATDPNSPAFISSSVLTNKSAVTQIVFSEENKRWTQASTAKPYWEQACLGDTNRSVRLAITSAYTNTDVAAESFIDFTISAQLTDQARSVVLSTYKDLN